MSRDMNLYRSNDPESRRLDAYREAKMRIFGGGGGGHEDRERFNYWEENGRESKPRGRGKNYRPKVWFYGSMFAGWMR